MKLKHNRWDEVSIALYKKILEITKDESTNETEKNISVLALLCEVDEEEVWNLSVDDVKELMANMGWLTSFDFNSDFKMKKVMVGDVECKVELDINKMTIAQYIDFQESYKGGVNADNMAQILSCFFIPKGHKYGDGYDVVEFISKIENNVPITVANSACFFFLQELASSMRGLKLYLNWMLRKMKRKSLKMEEKKKIEELQERADNLYGYLSSMK